MADRHTPGSGWRDGAAHSFRVRVYYEDTDAGGIVYHANYLKFAERARTEFLRHCGVGQDRMRAEDGVGFAVRRCLVDYKRAARLDDVIEVRTRLHGLTGARVNAEQCLHRVDGASVEDDWCARLELELACINAEGRAVRLPRQVRDAFAGALADQ